MFRDLCTTDNCLFLNAIELFSKQINSLYRKILRGIRGKIIKWVLCKDKNKDCIGAKKELEIKPCILLFTR